MPELDEGGYKYLRIASLQSQTRVVSDPPWGNMLGRTISTIELRTGPVLSPTSARRHPLSIGLKMMTVREEERSHYYFYYSYTRRRRRGPSPLRHTGRKAGRHRQA